MVLTENGGGGLGTTGRTAWLDYISPGYFRAMETPILMGRDFDVNDTATSVKVAIVNQTFVKKFWATAKAPLASSSERGSRRGSRSLTTISSAW